jgi:hypothetical protein
MTDRRLFIVEETLVVFSEWKMSFEGDSCLSRLENVEKEADSYRWPKSIAAKESFA